MVLTSTNKCFAEGFLEIFFVNNHAVNKIKKVIFRHEYETNKNSKNRARKTYAFPLCIEFWTIFYFSKFTILLKLLIARWVIFSHLARLQIEQLIVNHTLQYRADVYKMDFNAFSLILLSSSVLIAFEIHFWENNL